MSKFSQTNSGGNQMNTKYSTEKIFIGENRFKKGEYVNNSSYDPIVLPAGRVMGRIASSKILVPCTSNATDGSQYPVGVLAHDLSVDSGDTVKATICVGGNVAEELLSFSKPGDTLDTVVSDRLFRDRLASDTMGLYLTPGSDHTAYDNE